MPHYLEELNQLILNNNEICSKLDFIDFSENNLLGSMGLVKYYKLSLTFKIKCDSFKKSEIICIYYYDDFNICMINEINQHIYCEGRISKDVILDELLIKFNLLNKKIA